MIGGSSHVYKPRLPASSQIVNQAIFSAFVLRYGCCLHVSYPWLTRSPPLTHTLFLLYDSVVPKLPTLIAYWACLAACERMLSNIWALEMASQSMIGLVPGSMAKGGVDLVQNLILDSVVAFLFVCVTQPDLLLLSLLNDAILSSVP